MKPEIVVFKSREALSQAAAVRIARAAVQAVDGRNRFYLVLSGGETPVETYRLLAENSDQLEIPWSKTHVFWGDERCVAPGNPESNYGVARAVLLNRVPIPEENIHRIRGELPAGEAAHDYRQLLQDMADPGQKWPVFDFTLLGLGIDGHFASLFPGEPNSLDRVAAIPARAIYEGRPAERVTLTTPILNDSRQVVFLVSGKG